MRVVTSALPRRNIPDTGRMRGDVVETIFEMHTLGRWWVFSDRHAGPPLGCRPDRPRHETATAVRADVVELVLDAVRAEGALKAADARFRRIRRKVLVAIFAVRSQLQRHGRLVMSGRGASSQIKPVKRMTNLPRFRTPAVIPGRAPWRGPGIHTPDRRYGFRARSFHSRPGMTSKNEPPYRANSPSGSFELSFNRSSTIDERTCATLW